MGDGPVIAEDVAAFVESGDVGIWFATANLEHVPQTARAMGARVDRARSTVALYVPSAQGARVLANAREGAKLAATFVRITNYRAVQVKGEIASCRPCHEHERVWPERYRERFAEANTLVGMPRELIMQLTCWPATVIEVRVLELYAQTPGPNAGARL